MSPFGFWAVRESLTASQGCRTGTVSRRATTMVEAAARSTSTLRVSRECRLGEGFASGEAQRLALFSPGKRQTRVGHQFGRGERRRLAAVQNRHDDAGREKVQAH
jgi:hypothetical protein